MMPVRIVMNWNRVQNVVTREIFVGSWRSFLGPSTDVPPHDMNREKQRAFVNTLMRAAGEAYIDEGVDRVEFTQSDFAGLRAFIVTDAGGGYGANYMERIELDVPRDPA